MNEPVWQGGAWLTRRVCQPDDPLKWELGIAGEVVRLHLDARGLYALKLAIEVQLATLPRPWPCNTSSADH